jgi:hypothetical protein
VKKHSTCDERTLQVSEVTGLLQSLKASREWCACVTRTRDPIITNFKCLILTDFYRALKKPELHPAWMEVESERTRRGRRELEAAALLTPYYSRLGHI